MKLKKQFSFSDKNQIWRLLISNSDKLIVETRDIEKKVVFFHCIDLLEGKKIFKSVQLEEKFWIGIESIYKDIIYFHGFAKPNMPEHKKIIAFDLNKQSVIWKNDELFFLSVIDDRVYCARKKFEGQIIYSLDYLTGEEIENFGNNPTVIDDIVRTEQNKEDYAEYRYPELVDLNYEFECKELVIKELNGIPPVEHVELVTFMGHLFFNYYIKTKNNLLENKIVVYNIEKKKKVLSDILNSNLNSFSPDSFFLYKRFLIVLKNKDEIICYKLS